MAFIDPHEQLFRQDRTEGPLTSSYVFRMKEHKDEMAKLSDQWLPYKHSIFNVNDSTFQRGHYDHTLFRFPLRSGSYKSYLAQTQYTTSKVDDLFTSFKQHGHLDLLFLKHLESIELYKKTHQGDAKKYLEVRIAQESLETLRSQRQSFLTKIRQHEEHSVTYPVTIEQIESNNGDVKKRDQYTYLVCQYFSEAGAANVKELSASLGHLPIVGVTLPLSTSSSQLKPGQIFCFLPLPLGDSSPTGLAVHVNGYFAVDQNRRHLKWPTTDQNVSTLTDPSLLWNIHLAGELVPRALAHLVLYAVSLAQRPPQGNVNISPQQVALLLSPEAFDQMVK